MQDAAGKLGGSLIFSTSSTGSSSTGSSQLEDQLTINSDGLATFSGSITVLNPTGALTVSGSTLLNTLSTSGNTVIGTTSSQTLTVNAATNFAGAIIAAAPVSILAGNPFSASGDTTVGTNSNNTLSINARTTFAAPVTANAGVTVAAGNAFSAMGNTTVGSSAANSMVVNAAATFLSPATFSQALQLYSNSSTAGEGMVLGFQRASNGGAVSSGFTLGSILFSGYDGSVQGPTAQIRSVLTVCKLPVSVVHEVLAGQVMFILLESLSDKSSLMDCSMRLFLMQSTSCSGILRMRLLVFTPVWCMQGWTINVCACSQPRNQLLHCRS